MKNIFSSTALYSFIELQLKSMALEFKRYKYIMQIDGDFKPLGPHQVMDLRGNIYSVEWLTPTGLELSLNRIV
jgi:hypothetical protein